MKGLFIYTWFFIFFLNQISSQALIDPKLHLWDDGEVKNIFILLKHQTNISAVKSIRGKEQKTAFVYQKLLHENQLHQKNILAYLAENQIRYRNYYIVNGIALTANNKVLNDLKTFPEISIIMEDGTFIMTEPIGVKEELRSIEWGIDKIKSRQVWNQGFRGQNVIIGGQDTGYEWDHQQLLNKYKGWNGSSANHNFHWHDAIYANHPMNSGSNPCGYNLSAPCDDHNHGTHTMGTMVGNHLNDTIGVAPDAKWIGCRNMERGYGSLSSYVECFEWFLAPYAYGDGPEDGDPSKMPHVINNSWSCPTAEGCNTLNFFVLEEALMNLRNAGCVIVVSNGNSGGSCSSTYDPPAFFEGSFSVGSINSTNTIAGSSSRGPVTADNSNRLKPNVVAPGVSVRSSIRNGNYASFSGTSMAGPHVAGAVALIISANPDLAGEVDQIEDILEQTTMPLFGGNVCGGIPTTAVPNNTYGYGLIDVEKAVARARNLLYTHNIKIDQFGYRPSDKKVAILSNPIQGYNNMNLYVPGTNISLKNSNTHQVIFSSAPVPWDGGNTHTESGDKVWYFDFSNVTNPGKYYVADGALRSEDFIINDTIYYEVLKAAFKTFYFQRCGVSKSSPFTLPGFDDNACHLQDTLCKYYATPEAQSRWKNLSGGWHDAGDYNKYVNFAYAAVFDLLMAFQLYSEVWMKDIHGIPESGNGIPDLLDEIKFEIDWLLKMQENDGGVLCVVGVANNTTDSPPSSDLSERLYGPKTTSASFSAASMMAFTALQFKKVNDPYAQQYANILETAAVNAYTWASNNPNVTFYNSGIIAAGEQELDSYETTMRQLSAAVFLFSLTNNVIYKNFVEANYTQSHFKQWNYVYPFENPIQLSLLLFAHLPSVTQAVSLDIKNTFKNSLENSSDNLPAHINSLDAYRAYLSPSNHTWGSNQTKCNMANLYNAYHQFGLNLTNNSLIEEISTDYLHYIHGRNPTGLCFLSNMESYKAYKSINTLYHSWFVDGSTLWDDARTSTYGPAPGYLTGGVNPNYSLDFCCSNSSCGTSNTLCTALMPPLNQPILKSYLDWNTGWPQNSWQITEPAIYYQSSYLLLLSSKVGFTPDVQQNATLVHHVLGDIDIESYPKGIVLTASNGSKFRILVNNNGIIYSTIESNPIQPSAKVENGDAMILEANKGVLVRSQNGSLWRLFINTSGALTTEILISTPPILSKITNGDLYFTTQQKGIILKDRDAICYKLTVDDSGILFTSVIACD
ncbi:MAG: glycoside hydrolase family 9 protein [Saprospiraceae bacterium]